MLRFHPQRESSYLLENKKITPCIVAESKAFLPVSSSGHGSEPPRMLLFLPRSTSHASGNPVGSTCHLPESHHHSSPWLLRPPWPSHHQPGLVLLSPSLALTAHSRHSSQSKLPTAQSPAEPPPSHRGRIKSSLDLKALCLWPE